MITPQACWGIRELARSRETQQWWRCRETQTNATRPALGSIDQGECQNKAPRQCKQLRRARTPWHEKRPQQRAGSQPGAAEERGGSKLAFPADQAGSDQRARWNLFIWHERPFRTRARAATADAKGPLKRPPMGDPQAIHPQG